MRAKKRKLKNQKYAQGYLINILKREKQPIDIALRETIKAMGLKVFANKARLFIQAVSDFVSQRQKWSTDKIALHIEDVFNLTMKISLENPKTSKTA